MNILLALLGCAKETDTGKMTCGSDELLDEAGACVPTSCGAGRWGDGEIGAAAVFVDGAGGGGDGSEGTPYATIGEAIGAGATEIHVAAGTYDEFFEFKGGDPITIAGRCAALVTIDTSGSDKYGIRVKNGADLTLSDVLVTGAPHIGLAVDDATASLANVEVSANSWHGVNISGGSTFTMVGGSIADTQPVDGEGGYGFIVQEGSVAEVTGTLITRNAGFGVGMLGAELRVHGVEVSDTVASDAWGYGVWLVDGSTFTADQTTAITRNSDAGVSVSTLSDPTPSYLELTDTTISHTNVYLIDSGVGGEVDAEAVGVALVGNVDAHLTRCDVSGNVTGLLAWGTDQAGAVYDVHATIEDSTFTGVSPLPDVGEAILVAPAEIAAYQGAVIEIVRSTIGPGLNPGVLIHSASQLTITDSMITSLASDSGQFLTGLLATIESTVTATNLTVTDIAGSGVAIQNDSVLDAENLVVTEIHEAALSDAVEFANAFFVVLADANVRGATITDVDGLGVVLRGGTLEISDVLVTDVHGLSDTNVGRGIDIEWVEGDPPTSFNADHVSLSAVEGIGIFLDGEQTTGTFSNLDIADGLGARTAEDTDGAAGIVVQAGAQVTVQTGTIIDQPGLGVIVNGGELDPAALGVVEAGLTASDLTIHGVSSNLETPAIGVVVQAHARFEGTRVEVQDVGDVGFYSIVAGSLDCTDCGIDGFEIAGAVAQADGTLALHNTVITGIGAGAFGLYGSGRYYPASLLFDEGSSVESGGLAAAYLDGVGAWQFADCDLGGGAGSALGGALVHGNAIFASASSTWDEVAQTGLHIERCSLHDSPGPALLLQQGTATVCDLTLANNVVDVAWQDCPTASEPEACSPDDVGTSNPCPGDAWVYLDPASVGIYFTVDDIAPVLGD